MPVKQTTTYLSKNEDCQLTISSNFLEESVILTLSSPTQDFRPLYLELPAEDLETLIQHLAAVYAELALPEGPEPQMN
jgi:hypothetical protein